MVKAVETNCDIGGGIPAFLSDQSAVNRARALGVDWDDAIEWSAAGCLNYVIGNTNFLPRGVGNIVLPKVLEITLHNGVDPRTVKRVGLKTGDATKFTSLEELYSAWEKQFDYFVGKLVQGVYIGQSAKMENYSAPLTTALAEQNGLVFNMKFSRPMLQNRQSVQKLLAMIKTFFDRGGWHIQFNITSREDLLDAQKHPEQWRDLVVRVAGYSAYFVDLPRDVQDEIIARTAHEI